MKKHLEECVEYRQKQINLQEAQGLPPLHQISLLDFSAKRAVNPLTSQQHEDLQKAAAYAVFCGACPFILYDDPAMNAFLSQIQPDFNPLS